MGRLRDCVMKKKPGIAGSKIVFFLVTWYAGWQTMEEQKYASGEEREGPAIKRC